VDNGEIGLEATPSAYVDNLVRVFREVRRVLRDDGTLWVNLGASYAGGGNYRGTNEDTLTSKQRSNRGAHGMDAMGREFVPPTCRIPADIGFKPKDLIPIPWMVAMALQQDGWYLRADIIWQKPDVFPESVQDRPTKSHEYLFLLAKSRQYYYNADAIKEPAAPSSLERAKYGWHGTMGDAIDVGARAGSTLRNIKESGATTSALCPAMRNKRSVWTVSTTSDFHGHHFAAYPPALIEPCIWAGSKSGDLVLDPFSGTGTTGVVALRNNRRYIGIDLNPAYIEMSRKRLMGVTMSLFDDL
jgi:DNA modification methylase